MSREHLSQRVTGLLDQVHINVQPRAWSPNMQWYQQHESVEVVVAGLVGVEGRCGERGPGRGDKRVEASRWTSFFNLVISEWR